MLVARASAVLLVTLRAVAALSFWLRERDNRITVMSPGSETILIVDDDASVLALTESMLIRHGYRTLMAQGAAEAVHLFEIRPDLTVALALIDVVMPGVNGVELAVRLQELRPDLPV